MNKKPISIDDIFGLPILDLLQYCNDNDLIKLYYDTEQYMLDTITESEYNNDIIVECLSLINRVTGKNITTESHQFTTDYLCECIEASADPSVTAECLRDHIIRILLLGINQQGKK
jgi:hypothetical protein